jgi:hypothetical protein
VDCSEGYDDGNAHRMNQSSLGKVELDKERADVTAVEVHDTYQGEEQEVHSPKNPTRDDHTDNEDTVAADGSGGVVVGHDDAVVAADPKYLVNALLGAALLEDGETHFDREKGFDLQPW